jgi:hypothetical protein
MNPAMPDATSLFLDTEFTGLHQQAQLISLGLCAESGAAFYGEVATIDPAACDPWVRAHVLPHTRWLSRPAARPQTLREGDLTACFGDGATLAQALTDWLGQWPRIEIWADCLAYDWVLFCELFGGARQLPGQVFYMPFDLVTLFKLRGLDPDTDRVAYAGLAEGSRRHHALSDARLTLACYRRLLDEPARCP